MGRILRVLKSSAVIGVAWAVPWFLAGVGLALFSGGENLPWSLFLGSIVGAVGLAGGTVFALGLSAAERDRTLEDLSWARVGLMGAVGGVVALPIVNTALITLLGGSIGVGIASLVTMGVVGAVSSIGTLAIARAAPALPASESARQLE